MAWSIILGGSSGSSISTNQRVLERMPLPNIKVFNSKSELPKECSRIDLLRIKEKKEFWEKSTDVCERSLKRLKKVTYLLKGDSLLFEVDYKGCPAGINAVALRCKNE